MQSQQEPPQHILWGRIETHFSSSDDSRGKTDCSQSGGAQVLFQRSDSAGTPSSDTSCSSEWGREKRAPTASSGSNLAGAQIPLDADGNPTSIGSIEHATGNCAPCDFVLKPAGCKNGLKCPFCHFKDHTASKQRRRTRPCKGKRNRSTKFLDKMKEKIEEDPENFDFEDEELPPSIVADVKLKARLAAKMQLHKEEVRAKRGMASADATDDAADDTSSAAVLEAARPVSTDPVPPKPRNRKLISL